MIQLLIALAAGALLVWIMKSRMNAVRPKGTGSFSQPEEKEEQIFTDSTDPSAPDPSTLNHSEINRAYRIADMHFSRGDFEEAEKWFIKVLALHEYHPETLNRLGVIYIQQNNPRRAEILYRKLFSVTQKEPAYYCNYGRCLYNQGRLEDALEAYENAIKLDSTRPSRFVSVGQIYYEQKQFEKALQYFARALELDPQNVEYLWLIAELAETLGEEERLLKSLRKILDLDPYSQMAKTKLEQFTKPRSEAAGSSTQMDLL